MTNWDCRNDSWTCGLTYGGGKPPHLEYSQPLSAASPSAFRGGQQLVFSRSFEGRGKDKHYYEIAQSLTHAHDLHWTPERHAWCRFDDNGDLDDVIKWATREGRAGYGSATCITIDRATLEMHMSATGVALVQIFDVASVGANFSGWNKYDAKSVEDLDLKLYFRYHREGANGSWIRGAQIIKPRLSSEEYGEYLYEKMHAPKQYASFITQDWKNERIAEVSCAPDAMASYFEKDSHLPFQTSPVFFNAAVLDKYKADSEKYSLDHRSISRRNSWHLQTYDVNDAGQVHTYIRYLGYLPYSEQLYWKSFNENPKDSISKRAFTTDFEGQWSDHSDPLIDLQNALNNLHASDVNWFTLREPNLVSQLHYPLTSSAKAWGDTLITLTKLVAEGLEKRFFEDLAKSNGATGDARWGSIRWAEEAMKSSGTSAEVIGEVIRPLRKVQELRTKPSAHSGGNEASSIRAELLRDYKTPRAHIGHLCAQLAQSLQILRDLN